MEVRLLRSSDAKDYWNLRLEALKQNPEAFATSYKEAINRVNPIERAAQNLDAEGSFTFGVFDNNQLIGTVTLLKENLSKLQHRANLVAMYVTPAKRGIGIGKALLEEVVSKAKILKLEKVNLSVVSNNESAKKLYKSIGFKVFGIEEKALKVNDTYYDEEHMVLAVN